MRIAALLTVLIALWGGASEVPADESAKDLTAMSGKWKIVSSEFEGKSATEVYKRTLIVIEGDELFFTEGFVQSKKQKFKLDPTSDPKAIDIARDAKNAGKGIYSIDKDVLKLCFNTDPAGSRPKEFKTKTGDKTNLFVLERQKP